MADLQALAEAVIKGSKEQAEKLTQEAIDEGVAPERRSSMTASIAGMSVVGERFKNNEFYVPEVLIAARAMQSAMGMVKPLLAEGEITSPRQGRHRHRQGRPARHRQEPGRHDARGRRLRGHRPRGGCLPRAVRRGRDGEQARTSSPCRRCLTTTMPSMKDTVDALKEAGVRDRVKVVIGGAPVTQSYADEIGADGYAPDAASAVDKVAELLA